MKAFSGLHPVVLLFYYILTIGFSMFILNPICLAISFFCALLSSLSLDGHKKLLFNLKYMIPMILLTMIINPAFNHRGATILTYLPSGNPLTLESILYGAVAGIMLSAVICHFSCFNSVMTSDKLVYLSGRLSPALSLIFSMTLRLVPRFIAQTKRVGAARKAMGQGVSSGSLLQRIKNGTAIISVMVTHSLESAIEMADSMKSRGYGLKGRTAFSLFRFDKRDALILILSLIFGAYVMYGHMTAQIYWRWFPTIRGHETIASGITFYIAYAALMCLCPVVNYTTEASFKKSVGGKGI